MGISLLAKRVSLEKVRQELSPGGCDSTVALPGLNSIVSQRRGGFNAENNRILTNPANRA